MTDAEDREFALLYLQGERFARGRLPVEALVEIQRYQRLVLDAARLEWMQAHPDEELPEGFDAQFELTITRIGDGSAKVVLERPVDETFATYYEQGRDELERELAAILDAPAEPEAQPVASELPLLLFRDLQEFGASLDGGDSIRVGTPTRNAATAPPLTPTTRANVLEPLVREAVRVAEREKARENRAALSTVRRSIAGRLVALNADTKKFDVLTLLHGSIGGSYKDPALTEDLRRVLESSAKAPVVRFLADVQSKRGRIWRITDVESVELFEVDGQPWSRKFIDLASLAAGWNDEAPGAAEIAFSAMDAARDLMARFAGAEMPRPGIFPTEEGGVLLEWASVSAVISIEISPDVEFELFRLPEGSDESQQYTTVDIDAAFDFAREVLQ